MNRWVSFEELDAKIDALEVLSGFGEDMVRLQDVVDMFGSLELFDEYDINPGPRSEDAW